MNYISFKACSFLISGSGSRFVVYETFQNGVITLYKSIKALRLCTLCFPKQIKWCLWYRKRLSSALWSGKLKEGKGGKLDVRKQVEEEGRQKNQNKTARAKACWEDNLHFQLSPSHAGRETDVCRRAEKKTKKEIFNLFLSMWALKYWKSLPMSRLESPLLRHLTIYKKTKKHLAFNLILILPDMSLQNYDYSSFFPETVAGFILGLIYSLTEFIALING